MKQNSIGHTQIIISQDFKWIPEELLTVIQFAQIFLTNPSIHSEKIPTEITETMIV